MKIKKFLATAVLSAAALAAAVSCAGGPKGVGVLGENRKDARTIVYTLSSAAIRTGKNSGRDEHYLFVRLPASYGTGSRRYPVVYTFHGYGDPPDQLLRTLGPAADAAAAAGGPEYILVGVDGSTSLGGSFWVDSPATGNWERWVTEEVVPFVESRFRCVAEPRGRALAGFSMGGFAAWRIGLARADLFSAFWAACPGALEGEGVGVRDAMPGWNKAFRTAYGAAFAPDLSLPPPYARIPALDGSAADEEIVRLWEGGFGQADEKIAAYLAKPARLAAARFDYGEYDSYGWIPRGTVALEARMRSAGIPVGIASWKAGHAVAPDMILEGWVPFIGEVFAGYR